MNEHNEFHGIVPLSDCAGDPATDALALCRTLRMEPWQLTGWARDCDVARLAMKSSNCELRSVTRWSN